ncbi:unnamed protein product [Coregonus sp. 'balchen']|nr:unnamed protein product [Coregonus sp. 'balchen']
MWQVVQRGDVQDYGMLEEFVTTVTEIVPELLSCSKRAQLILGLRARMVLELCRTEQTADQDIQQHLDRIRSLISTGEAETATLLNAVPSALEKCVQFVPDPIQLRTLLQYHRKRTPSSFGDCILSSLSLPPYVRVVTAPDVDSDTQSESMNLEGMEARELLENRTKEIDGLVPADEVRRDVITEQEYGTDMETALGKLTIKLSLA